MSDGRRSYWPSSQWFHVLTLDVAGFVEALAERASNAHRGFGRPTVDKADHRHRCLLPARRERPCGSCPADKRDELAPFQLSELHPLPLARVAA
jgi:hypothetical protein